MSSRATTTLTTATLTRADLAEELHEEERVPQPQPLVLGEGEEEVEVAVVVAVEGRLVVVGEMDGLEWGADCGLGLRFS